MGWTDRVFLEQTPPLILVKSPSCWKQRAEIILFTKIKCFLFYRPLIYSSFIFGAYRFVSMELAMFSCLKNLHLWNVAKRLYIILQFSSVLHLKKSLNVFFTVSGKTLILHSALKKAFSVVLLKVLRGGVYTIFGDQLLLLLPLRLGS